MHRLLIAAFCFLSSCQFQQNDRFDDVEFITQPCLIPTEDNQFKLCDNMIVRLRNAFHSVPMGFKTDLASIPRIMWPVFSPGDYDTIAPAVLHDWHYCCESRVTRKWSDDIFYYGLREQGMGAFKAGIYWFGVRSIGWIYYTHGEGILKHENEFSKDELQGILNDVHYRMG